MGIQDSASERAEDVSAARREVRGMETTLNVSHTLREHLQAALDQDHYSTCFDRWHDCTCSYPGQFKSGCPYTAWLAGKRCKVCSDRRDAANAFRTIEGG